MMMPWMRMSGESWLAAGASFVAMWLIMMAAMMLPSLVPALRRYRDAVRDTSAARLAALTALVIAGYFLVWGVIGVAIFPAGVAIAGVDVRQPLLAWVVRIGAGAIIVLAGALQFTRWKAHHLACCRAAPARRRTLPADVATALRHGVHLGVHCSACSAGMTMMLLVVGIMDPRAMAVVAVATTMERVAPGGLRVARVIGGLAVAAGIGVIVRAGS